MQGGPATDLHGPPAVGSAVTAFPARLRSYVQSATAMRRAAALLTAGALSTLAHAPFFAWPILFLTLPILFWAIEALASGARPQSRRSAAWRGLLFAFGYFFTGLYWVGEAFLVEAEIFAWLLPFAITLLPFAMSLYWAAAAFLTHLLWERLECLDEPGITGVTCRVLIFAVVFSLIELLRGHLFTGLPWHNPGLALAAPLELMQLAALVGMYGMAPIVFLVTLMPLVSLAAPGVKSRRAIAPVIALTTLVPLAMAYAWGAMRLAEPTLPDVPGVKIRLVQPSIPQREKWRPEKQADIFARHLELSRRDPEGRDDGLAGITHVIWPEASMPFGPLHNQSALDAVADMLPDGSHLIAGLLRRGDQSVVPAPVHNSLAALDTTGKLVALYDKVHLVPFGEFLPFPDILEAIGLQNLVRQRGGFTPGPWPKKPMSVPGLPPVAPVICYEAIFPGEIIPQGPRPGLIIIATNDGWFGRSIGPAQHFHQARFRAVELGLPVVRSANNGISALIDAAGRVRVELPLDRVATADIPLPAVRAEPLAAQLGVFGVLFANLFLLTAFTLIRIGNQRTRPGVKP